MLKLAESIISLQNTIFQAVLCCVAAVACRDSAVPAPLPLVLRRCCGAGQSQVSGSLSVACCACGDRSADLRCLVEQDLIGEGTRSMCSLLSAGSF